MDVVWQTRQNDRSKINSIFWVLSFQGVAKKVVDRVLIQQVMGIYIYVSYTLRQKAYHKSALDQLK